MGGYCGECGSAVAATAAFCGECGHPVRVARPGIGLPTADSHSLGRVAAPTAPGRARRGRRVGIAVLAAALTVVLVLSVVIAGNRLLGGSGSRVLGGPLGQSSGALPEPVEESPEQAWTHQVEDESVGATVIDDALVFVDDEGRDVISLDSDGQVRWRVDNPLSYAGLSSAGEGTGVALVSAYEEEADVAALSGDDGEVLWQHESVLAGSADQGVLLMDPDTEDFELVDARTGESRWTTPEADDWAVLPGLLVRVEGSRVVAHDLDTGEERWSADTNLPAGSEDFISVDGNESMVVAWGANEAVALDADDGEQLWSESDARADSFDVDAFSSDRVVVAVSWYDEDSETSELRPMVWGREGRVGELETEFDVGSIYIQRFEIDGEEYALDQATGILYDSDITEVGDYAGEVQLADGGLYELDEDRLRYYDLGSRSAGWELSFAAEYVTLLPADGRIFVIEGNNITAYR